MTVAQPLLDTRNALVAGLARRESLERLMADVAHRFVGLHAGQVDGAITDALARIGAFVSVDRSYVFVYDAGRRTMSNTHEWCYGDVEPQIGMLQDLPLDVFRWVVDRLAVENCVEVPLVADLPAEAAAEKDILEQQDIQSLILVSLRSRKGHPIGFIGFDAVRSVRPWHPEDRHLLELAGDLIAATIEHRDMVKALESSETHVRAVLEAVPDMMFILDGEGRVLHYKAPHDARLAVPPGQVVGTSIRALAGEDQWPVIRNALVTAARLGRSDEFEYRLEIAGEPLDFEGRITRQGPDEFLAMVREITNRKQSEKALRRLALQLTRAEEEQRRELAMLLHDGVGQELTAVMLRLHSVARTHDLAEGPLGDAMRILERAMRHTQELTFDLSPPSLYELGLENALHALVRRFGAEFDLDFAYESRGERLGLQPDLGILFYRTARELMMNAVKHSGASRVLVETSRIDGAVRLAVRDDGRGLDAAAAVRGTDRNGGFGLFSIRQRIEPLGGNLDIVSGGGTCISITVPFGEEGGTASLEANT
ncbi:MAG TPA: ATP-binding protein [Candidatus Krumholzibacteria bacterium]|nr:ATP-binding protein [Candidatus Krumholzibacteria bacterium]